MRKFLILSALLIGFAPTLAFAQMRGGPPVQTNTPDNGNSPVSTNPMDQYLQRKSLQDLTDSQRAAVSELEPARAANANELIAGAVVNDKTGAPMAKVAEVDADGVVVVDGYGEGEGAGPGLRPQQGRVAARHDQGAVRAGGRASEIAR